MLLTIICIIISACVRLGMRRKTVESSMEASDHVTMVTFLYILLLVSLKNQHQLNDVRVLHKWRQMENY